MYLKSVTFKNDTRCFAKHEHFGLGENIVLLVGDQGCGKSTLLELLGRNDKLLDVGLTELGHKGVSTFFFDTEKMNPRIKDPNSYTNPNGTDSGFGYGNALISRFTSHGETLARFTVDAIPKAKDSVIFLDEPESGLSLRNQFRLADVIAEATTRNCQFVIATHCLPLIQFVSSVLSLEHKTWMASEEFIQSQGKLKNA